MRATIKFEVDVDQVENTMAMVVAMEAGTLRAVADMIDVNPGPRTMVLEEVTEALRLLSEVTTQLHQYQQMLDSFERARFETRLPQPAPPDETLKVAATGREEFGDFVDRMSSQEEVHGGEHKEG